MSGGGFLKQGADSAKYNRSLLGKEPHKPFERKNDHSRTNVKFVDSKTMSAELQREIQQENLEYNRGEIRQKIIVSIVTIVLLMVVLIVMFY